MLPRRLCEDLCSLNPGVDRLAFSVIFELTPQGEVISEWFGRTVIKSCVKLGYPTAQLVIDGKLETAADVPNVCPEVEFNQGHSAETCIEVIQNLQSIASKKRIDRVEGGALTKLKRMRLGFIYDAEG